LIDFDFACAVAMVRAVMAARNLKVDIINMSYGEPSSRPNVGRVLDIMNELVFKHNVLFVASAGNSGPCLTTTGAPGGLSSGLISVGAVVTPDMAQVQYTIREPVDEKHYTWSSRGPAYVILRWYTMRNVLLTFFLSYFSADGGLGVWISAPGGAIASVPNWTLQKNQLMNGTSMSSPNACGGLSVLLSALKSEERKYSADFIKRAIAVTGRELPNSNPLTYGHGMLQVAKAYDYIIKNPFPADVRINATTAHNEGKARGIYLREPHMTTRPHEELIDISPVFDDSVANADKIKFEMRINITCDQKWVEVPAHLVLMNGGRQFKVKVNPTAVPIGTVGLAFIRGYDAATSGQAPVFEVPVTVVQPYVSFLVVIDRATVLY
jgi:tripeptidyl-peptidase-2